MKLINTKYIYGLILFVFVGFFANAADTILNIHRNDNTVDRFYLYGITDMTTDEAANELVIKLKLGLIVNIDLGTIDSITYTQETVTPAIVSLTVAEYDKSLEQIVCGVSVSEAGGLNVVERGLVYSKTGIPSYPTNKQAFGSRAGKFYSVISNIKSTEEVYVRPYAITSRGIFYGQTEKVSEITGNVTYTLDIDKNQYPRQYELIKTALDSAIYYYNRYTPFETNIHVYYNEGIPTAQASYHGSLGFGANERYMYVGTAMHEMAHFFGSGTTSVWQSMLVGGVWQGESGQSVCKELTGDQLRGDNNDHPQHYWPTGINQKEEVKGVQDLINHAKVVKAMLVDDCGLPTKF